MVVSEESRAIVGVSNDAEGLLKRSQVTINNVAYNPYQTHIVSGLPYQVKYLQKMVPISSFVEENIQYQGL